MNHNSLLSLDLESAEAHEGKGHETNGDEGDTQALEGLRNVVILHFLTNTCEADDSQEPSDTRTEGVHKRVSEGSDGLGIHCGQADTLLHEERTTHDGAVHGNQR